MQNIMTKGLKHTVNILESGSQCEKNLEVDLSISVLGTWIEKQQKLKKIICVLEQNEKLNLIYLEWYDFIRLSSEQKILESFVKSVNPLAKGKNK